MQDIEPYYRWRDYYIADEDENSPFFGREYSEFTYTNTVYNYYIHPQWDEFGSSTLYLKVIFVDYDENYAIIEFIGEWNDTIGNDVMFLKRDVIDPMIEKGIYKFILIAENVLNFHGADDAYYEEWWEDIADEYGWIVLLNTEKHVNDEMQRTQLQHFVNFGGVFQNINWRPHKPERLFAAIETLLNGNIKQVN